jgi:hypothetical protein
MAAADAGESGTRMPRRVRAQTLVASALLLLAWASGASAFTLKLSGSDGGAALDRGVGQTLYSSDAVGRPVPITSIGAPGPSGGTIIDMGLPAMLPDGRVVFGAELSAPGGSSHWALLIADRDASAGHGLVSLLDGASHAEGCSPVMRMDPSPRAGRAGEIAFTAAEASGGDALFLYSHGTVSCIVRTGGRTFDGDLIATLEFGSQDVGASGEVVFSAWIKSGERHLRALLMESKGTSRVLAREGGLGPNRARFASFGLPAAVATGEGTMVAFTAQTESATALFTYSEGQMTRVLSVGTLTAVGPISYLSPGRPALMPNGVVAVLAACGRLPAIFRLGSSHLDLEVHRGQVTPFGTELESFSDPALSDSGTLYVGAADSEGSEKIYVLSSDGAFSALGSDELLYKISFRGDRSTAAIGPSLVVNGRGDFAYLGGR